MIVITFELTDGGMRVFDTGVATKNQDGMVIVLDERKQVVGSIQQSWVVGIYYGEQGGTKPTTTRGKVGNDSVKKKTNKTLLRG